MFFKSHFVFPLSSLTRRKSSVLLYALLHSCLAASVAAACPKINGLPDYNCDEKLDIAILGDSFTYGFGDTKNGNKGGYVFRTEKKYRQVNFYNGGQQGLRTLKLLSDVTAAFKEKKGPLYTALIESDVVFLDLGRNDRWLFGTPEATFRNLKRIASTIKSKVQNTTGVAPLVITAVLMLPNRGSQGPWVKELNEIIFRSNSKSAPADLRFDLVSKRLIGTDQIHPTSEGYAALTKTFISYLSKNLLKKVTALRPDGDGDGVYDLFETTRFATDPQKVDSDDDGKSDREEIFVLGTNPLAAD